MLPLRLPSATVIIILVYPKTFSGPRLALGPSTPSPPAPTPQDILVDETGQPQKANWAS